MKSTAVSSEAWAKLRDWASVAGRGWLLLSGSVAHASLKTAVRTKHGVGLHRLMHLCPRPAASGHFSCAKKCTDAESERAGIMISFHPPLRSGNYQLHDLQTALVDVQG